MLFRTFNFKTPPDDLFLIYGGCNIENMSSIKLLGAIVSEHLSWKEHIMLMYNKLRQIFCVTLRIRPNLNEKTLLTLYNSLIIIHIRYCTYQVLALEIKHGLTIYKDSGANS